MVYALFNSVVQGELRPRPEPEDSPPGRAKSYPLPGKPPPERRAYAAYLAELLHAFPATKAAVEAEMTSVDARICPDRIDEPEPYIRTRLPAPFNRKTGFYHTLIRCEARRFRSETCKAMQNNGSDRQHRYNQTLKGLTGLLQKTQRLLRRCENGHIHDPDQSGRWIMQVLKLTLMELVLEMSERWAGIADIRSYTERILFTGLLDEPAPDTSPFERSPACMRAAAIRCIEEQADLGRLAELLAKIRGKLKTLSHATRPGAARDMVELHTILTHLENAFLLITLKPPFLKRDARRLTDPAFCREWVTGIGQEFATEKDPDRAADLLRDLREAARKLNPVFRGVLQLPDHLIRSEAVLLTEKVRQLEEGLWGRVGEGIHAGGVADHPAAYAGRDFDFVPSVRRRYVLKHELAEAFGVSERTLAEYLKDTNIRWVELSSNVRLYYREDVEAFLRDRTR